ncbi:type II toxin-antitoxin system RelE/ParE family toxin [Candidatus Woesearchaeota archaeon]|nr:type II toxin-antitoxin system RelE/ParE family toxin [Candidatus Woesearchaeota archaeon]
MEIIFSEEFKKEFKKIKEKDMRLKVIKQIKRLSEQPKSGKPLKYDLKKHRSLRVTPFRIIYRLEEEKIIINFIEHRKNVYK